MKIYGVVDSWTKTVILRTWLSCQINFTLRPVAELQEDVILLVDGNNLISCNIKEKKCSIVHVLTDRNDWAYTIESYEPNLSIRADLL